MKKIKNISLKRRKQFFFYFVLTFSTLLLITQFQNCSAGSGGGLKIGSDCVGTGCITPPPPSQCTSTFCGGYTDYFYWNNCEPHVLGWAWSDYSSPAKPVKLNFSNNASCSTITNLNRHDVAIAPLVPPVPSDYSGFDCKLASGSYPQNFSITSGTVQGASSVFNITVDTSTRLNTSLPPSSCSGSSEEFTNACTQTAYAAFGWLDTATFDGSCNLTIKGWAWSADSQSNTKLSLVLSDGTHTGGPIVPVGISYPGVHNYFPCVSDATTGFSYTFSSHKLSKSTAMSGGVATITAYAFSPNSAKFQALNPLTFTVPAGCQNP